MVKYISAGKRHDAAPLAFARLLPIPAPYMQKRCAADNDKAHRDCEDRFQLHGISLRFFDVIFLL
jgi:hypothetical protein